MKTVYDWPEFHSPLATEIIRNLPLASMNAWQIERMKKLLEKVAENDWERLVPDPVKWYVKQELERMANDLRNERNPATGADSQGIENDQHRGQVRQRDADDNLIEN